ncbi:Ferric iron ABC transporter, permease protein [hydrothermal vent metagenome]|uniref:Ferric iron ABC transporter, permease protein n=1 Tax=hydrothermal vent metagenome TaxID=652676 RepID=A0A3B0TRA9_9ZZZZ
MSGRAKRLPLVDLVLALVMGLPLIALAMAAFGSFAGGNSALSARMLPVALRDTGWLMAWVGLASATLGLSSAWLVSHFEFPGRRIFDWALILPLAIPTYLSAYTWVEFLDFTGPVQTAIRQLGGFDTIRDYWFPQIRTTGGAAFVMSLVLYPYVYLSCRAFFLTQSGAMNAAARTLGAGPVRTFFTITLPLSRPAVAVGVSLALMEVINDLGAVQYFGVNSLTSVIYSTWINRSNFAGAAQLAVTIVVIIASLIWLEQYARRNRRHIGAREGTTPPARIVLKGWRGFGALAFSSWLLAFGFGVPVSELVSIASKRMWSGVAAPGLISAGINTLLLGFLGAASCVIIGLITARRLNRQPADRKSKTLLRMATLGYAVPGTVLALGLLVPLGMLDGWINSALGALTGWGPGLVLSGTFFALIYAYTIRFLTISHSNIDTAIKKRGNSILDAARVLGSRGWKLLFRIELPSLTPAIFAAATLVFVEIVKELPATLLLRPIGVETLATLVYSKASAELFDAAAIPALMIVGAGLIPVILASRLSQRKRN